ncbi:MAG: hypothetical protein H6815_12645 [Phycisphaeraceae bacterium]|nr:hypothetical protein [Phycisphaeraceae bacterium]MCB9861290.1 hypothetical protein [Phycisphaeraceae bacterium]
MMHRPIDDREIVCVTEPWYPAFALALEMSMRDVRACLPFSGSLKKTERANLMHATGRRHFTNLVDAAGMPALTICEEPDGRGLDYMVLSTGEVPVAIRWARYNGDGVRRNSTKRSFDIQSSGHICTQPRLFGGDDEVDENGTDCPMVTLAYTVEDDYTEAGVAQWWIGRIVLIRERLEGSELIRVVREYERPQRSGSIDDEMQLRIRERVSDFERLQRLVPKIA